MPKKNKKVDTVVVIGDWFIDENWLVTRQDLYHSSSPGEIHYLSRHSSVDQKITNLCGAATLIEILRSYFKKNEGTQFEFLGYGVWNPVDDDLIKCTLCPHHTDKKLLSPYTLTSLRPVIKDKCPYSKKNCTYDVKLRNLSLDSNTSTNRIIRCFEGYGGAKPHQLYRFDWVLDASMNINLKMLETELKSSDINVVALVIEDHAAGVINEETIKKLLSIFKNRPAIKWYVRTKIDNPGWLEVLNQNKRAIDMIVVDFKFAEHKKGERRWWHGKHLSHAALELLGELTCDTTYKHGSKRDKSGINSMRAAVLLDKNTVFAKDRNMCYSIHQPPGEKQLINLGRTTIFYGSLIAQRLYADFSQERGRIINNFGDECYKALLSAHYWSEKASKKWNQEELYLYGDYSEALEALNITTHSDKKVEIEEYEKLWDDWNSSAENIGAIQLMSDNGTISEVLQLWRGEGTLAKYICVGGPKRDAINHLVSEIAKFNNKKTLRHSLSCLLSSPPGWGKSYLAKCLADHFDMEFLEFSIAQMSENQDLIECLATIASIQARTQKRTLIFIDEINAEIEGHSAIGLLLSPMWDGKFMKDGKTYRLTPGVWIFASTSRMDELSSDDKSKKITKGSDFVSRLNGPIIELDLTEASHWDYAIKAVKKIINVNINMDRDAYKNKVYSIKEYKTFEGYQEDKLKTEQVYLMTSLLNSKWGPISKIQKPMLQLFHDLLPLNGFRSLEFFASSFEGIQRGQIHVSNIGKVENSLEMRRHVILPNWWMEIENLSLEKKAIKWCREVEKIKENNIEKCIEKFQQFIKIQAII